MKTNFEKWKEDLKPKDLILPRLVDDGKTRCVNIMCSSNCPAENCPAKKSIKSKRANMKRWEHFAQKCDKWFLRWAKAPAKEENK